MLPQRNHRFRSAFFERLLSLHRYTFPGMPGKAEKVIATQFTAVCGQNQSLKIHHEVFVKGGSSRSASLLAMLQKVRRRAHVVFSKPQACACGCTEYHGISTYTNTRSTRETWLNTCLLHYLCISFHYSDTWQWHNQHCANTANTTTMLAVLWSSLTRFFCCTHGIPPSAT